MREGKGEREGEQRGASFLPYVWGERQEASRNPLFWCPHPAPRVIVTPPAMLSFPALGPLPETHEVMREAG